MAPVVTETVEFSTTTTIQMPTFSKTSTPAPAPKPTQTFTPVYQAPVVSQTPSPSAPAQKNCTMCGKKLSSFGVNMHEDKPYCGDCFSDVTAPTCKKCAQPLKDFWCEVDGFNFHEDCFKCAKCGKSLSGRGHFAQYGEYYCRPCV